MAVDMRRFTISVADKMNKELNEAKKETYCNDSKNEMIRDLIMRGLQDSEQKKTTEDKPA